MADYPSVLPLEAAQTCLEIVKARAIQARKQEFGLALWNVQGYIQRVVLGVPALPGCDSDDCDCPDMDDILYALEEQLYEYEEEGVELNFGSDGKADEPSMDIVTVIAIVSAIMQLIQLWRNRKDTPDTEDDRPIAG